MKWRQRAARYCRTSMPNESSGSIVELPARKWSTHVNLSKTQLAVLNNIRWYEAIFEAHELFSRLDGMVWLSREIPPSFHSNLVVLSASISRTDIEAYVIELESVPRPRAWSIKDSYACLDLSSFGFALLFEAQWIWRDPFQSTAREAAGSLVWAPVTTGAELAEWEGAWSGDARNRSGARVTRQFPDRLLASPDHAFFAGRFGGKIVAGGIANRSPGVVGLSNMFSPMAFAEETWVALVSCTSAAFPNTPLVGYERGTELQRAKNVGFAPIGPLRVWCRSK